MGRWAALLILGLSLAPLLRADGDSGKLLATPERYKDGELVPNTASATIRLGSGSDPLVGKRDGWAALGGAYCYARLTGVGLRGNGKSVLCRPFDEPETVSYVSVVCGAESKSSIGEPLALTLSLGTREVETQYFTLTEAGETQTLTFAFKPIEASDLRLSNDGDKTFEVRRVSWYADLPPITVDVAITPSTVDGIIQCSVGGTIRCSVTSCTGGSGTYVRARWIFNGATSSAIENLQSIATFTVPDREDTYPLSLEIVDDQGNSKTFSYTVNVVADATASHPVVTNITRTGFTLSWDRPTSGLTPEEFAVRVTRSGKLDVTLTPEWSAAGKGWRTDAFLLDDALDGLDAQTVFVVVPKTWAGNLKYSVNNAPWKDLERPMEGFFFGFNLSPKQTLSFFTEADDPPASLKLSATLSHTYADKKIPLEGQKLIYPFTDLPAGKTFDVSITSYTRQNDGTLTTKSIDLPITLLPIPRPAATLDGANRIRFNWDDLDFNEDEDPTINLRLFAKAPAETTLTPGLYLTRVLLTQSKAAKAIALTNTSDSPISLDGKNYTLIYSKYTWDFYINDAAGKKAYPLSVPAHGDLVIVANQYRPVDLREGTALATANAIRYIKDDGPITLLRGSTIVNSLRPVMDAVVRLPADSLTGATTTPAAQADATIDALYDPWPQAVPTATAFYEGSYTRNNVYCETARLLDDRPAAATRVWAELRTCLDGAESEPQIIELWAVPSGTPRPGFRLRLR